MKRLIVLSLALLPLTACGDDDEGLPLDDRGVPVTTFAPPPSEEQVGLDPRYYWPRVDSYCDPDVSGFRIYVTTGPEGQMFVVRDDSCLTAP